MNQKKKYNHSFRTAEKRLLFSAAGVLSALVLFCGCDKGEEPSLWAAETGGGTPFTVSMEQPAPAGGTKTSLVSGTSNWVVGDKIKAFSGPSFATGTVMTTYSPGAQALFFVDVGQATPDVSAPYYCFYPYTAATAPSIVSDGTITATLGNQTYAEDSFGANAVPMVSSTASGKSITFYNVYGLLKLTLNQQSGVGIDSIRVTSSAGEYLSGKATISYNSGNPTVAFTDADHRSTSLTLICTTPVSLNDADKEFYIALPPTPSSATTYGFTVKVFTSDSKVMTTTMQSVADNIINRNSILIMPGINFTEDTP